MQNITDDMRNEVRISYNIKSDVSRLNPENLFSMFSGDLPEGLLFDTVSEGNIVRIRYYSDKLVLFSKYLESNEKSNIRFYVKKFCEFILSSANHSYLLDINQIFCDEKGLYFIPSLFVNDGASDRLQEARRFLREIAAVPNVKSEIINPICDYAENVAFSVQDILNYIDNLEKKISVEQKQPAVKVVRVCPACGAEYENKYLFCTKCGGKLVETQRVIASAVSEEIADLPIEEKIPAEEERAENIDNEMSSEAEEIIEDTSVENEDKTEAIENFDPEKTALKKVRKLKVKTVTHKEIDLTENANSAKAEEDHHNDGNSEIAVPAVDKSENAVQVDEQPVNATPAEDKSENVLLPVDEKPENAVPAEDKPENAATVDEKPKSTESVNKKTSFGETTLLGFTNYGETAVLNGMANSFDTPNLIRKSTGEKIYITKRTFLIGKSKDRADYAVADNGAVSRVHAEISVVGSEYYVLDKDSTNHTYVNNSVIQPNSPHQVFDGDEIMFANEIFTFHLQ